MVQKEFILIILIVIVIYLISNNDNVVDQTIQSLTGRLTRTPRNKREFMTNDINNDMYLMDVANMNNNSQLNNSFMFNMSNEESIKVNHDIDEILYKNTSCENMLDNGENMLDNGENMLDNGENMLDNGENMLDNDGNGEKLYGSLYGQALNGKMQMHTNEEDMFHERNDNMPNNGEKLYGSLYGQALNGKMQMHTDEEDMFHERNNNMPNNGEKLYGSLYGQALQKGMNNPLPMDMSFEFDKPMPLNMDLDMDFNKSINPSMDMCPANYDPVICSNGKTYNNACQAVVDGQDVSKCKSSSPILKENMLGFNDFLSENKYNKFVGSNINNIRTDLDKIRASGTEVRILFPGQMATMDFRPQRININVSDNDIIKSVTMG